MQNNLDYYNLYLKYKYKYLRYKTKYDYISKLNNLWKYYDKVRKSSLTEMMSHYIVNKLDMDKDQAFVEDHVKQINTLTSEDCLGLILMFYLNDIDIDNINKFLEKLIQRNLEIKYNMKQLLGNVTNYKSFDDTYNFYDNFILTNMDKQLKYKAFQDDYYKYLDLINFINKQTNCFGDFEGPDKNNCYQYDQKKKLKIFYTYLVTFDGLLLKYANNDIKKNIDIVMLAIKNNPFALQFADNEFKIDLVFLCKAFIDQDFEYKKIGIDRIQNENLKQLIGIIKHYNLNQDKTLIAISTTRKIYVIKLGKAYMENKLDLYQYLVNNETKPCERHDLVKYIDTHRSSDCILSFGEGDTKNYIAYAYTNKKNLKKLKSQY